ncbi:MAG TPA: hypothetical protein VGD01_13895 [Candidatus Elarobacter sp.]|jgi:hypothetical protein
MHLRRLAPAAFAALFAASTSLAMLQHAQPAQARDHWDRHASYERHDRDDQRRFRGDRDDRRFHNDRDDRRFHHAYYNGYQSNAQYYNPQFGQYNYNPQFGQYSSYRPASQRSWNNGTWHARHIDRDDRRFRGNRVGWNNANTPHYRYARDGKRLYDPWRNRR